MNRFTDFIRSFASRADISQQDFDACMVELARAIRSRLERLGMHSQPPAFYGYPDFPTWEKALDLREGPTDPVLDVLEYAITDRLDDLAERLDTGVAVNIDGMVLLNVKHFLFERQRDQDRVGHAVFENVHAALLMLAQAGTITFEKLVGGKVRNPTIIRFRSGASFPPVTADEVSSALGSIEEIERRYLHLSYTNIRAQRALVEWLPKLEGQGVKAFQFRDLVSSLKQRVQQAHDSHNRPLLGEALPQTKNLANDTELIRITRPDTGYVDSEQYDRFLRHVREGIGTLPQERTRRGVGRLFAEILQHRDVDEELPSIDELARRLGSTRSTVHEHLQKLRAIVQQVHESS